MLAETFPLPLRCKECGGLLTALVGPSERVPAPIDWTCPYCQHVASTNFGGRLHWITKRLVAERSC